VGDKNEDANIPVTVVNITSGKLPSTGGIGTTIFYLVGGILVAGAAIVLIAKKRRA
jgi:LPXTG-motif cell wall-anchored protein